MGKFADGWVELSARDGRLNRDLAGVRGKLMAFADSAKASLALPLSIAGGGAAALAFLQGAITKASDLGETMNKARVVFGDSAGSMIMQAEDLSARFGLVRQASLDAASNIGLIAQGAGMAQGAAAALSQRMVQLAADAMSFYNVPFEEALEKIRAGLTGESEPLKAFGVLMNEAAVKSKAAELGLAGASGELTEYAKVAARAAIITEQMGAASGDLERTAGGTSNSMRRLQGIVAEVQTEIGQKLLGAVDNLIPTFERLANAVKDGLDSGPVEDFTSAVNYLSEAVGGVKDSGVFDLLKMAANVPGPLTFARDLGQYRRRALEADAPPASSGDEKAQFGGQLAAQMIEAGRIARALDDMEKRSLDVAFRGPGGERTTLRMTPEEVARSRARGMDVEYLDVERFRAGRQLAALGSGAAGLAGGVIGRLFGRAQGVLGLAGAGVEGLGEIVNRPRRLAEYTDPTEGARRLQLDAINGEANRRDELQRKANETLAKIEGGIKTLNDLMRNSREGAARGLVLRGPE